MFKYKGWMAQIAYVVGVIALVTLPFRASAWWLVPTFLTYIFLLLLVTVGLHRLFCHRAFKVARPIHVAMIYLSTLAVQGSGIMWATIHIAHHKYSDTDKDPHPQSGRWAVLLWPKYTEFAMRFPRRLVTDPAHAFVHRYYVGVLVAFMTVFYLIDPNLLFNVYLPGLGLEHLATSVVLGMAHLGGRPRDWPWLEFIVPACGEWSHSKHHIQPGGARHGRFDLGYHVIRAIAVKGSLR